MKTILHIGMPKTGTTALQECLRASRDWLAERGVLYPANPPGTRFNNHRMLLLGLLPYEALPRHMRNRSEYDQATVAEKYAEFLEDLGRQVRAARPAVTILSSESLFRHLDGRRISALRAALAPLGPEVSVAVYLRQPSEHYLSNLQQRLRQSADLGLLKPPFILRNIDSYARAFGRAAITARVYSRELLHNGDIIDDFFATHLPEAAVDTTGLTRPSGVNASVSAEAMDILRRYRLAFHAGRDDVSTRDSSRLVQALRLAGEAVGAPRSRLRPEIADFVDYGASDPLRLRDDYGIVFPRLDYRRLERRWFGWLPRLPRRPRRLEDLVVIDPAARRDMLGHLGGSDWAKARPERRAWIAGLLAEAAA